MPVVIFSFSSLEEIWKNMMVYIPYFHKVRHSHSCGGKMFLMSFDILPKAHFFVILKDQHNLLVGQKS